MKPEIADTNTANAAADADTPIGAVRARCADLLSQLRPLVARSVSADTTAAFEAARDELAELPADHVSTELVECLLLIAHFYYLSNKCAVASAPAAKATVYARSLGDKRLLRKALTIAGVMQMEAGNLPGATEAYAEALKVARELGEEEQEAPVWNNLGVALMDSAQYADALKCFERAATLASKSLTHATVEHQAQSNVAICALYLHDVRTGIRAVRRAIELNAHPENASDCLDRTDAETIYARLLLEIGEVGHAREHCDTARMYAEKAPTARAEHFAAITSGLVDVHSDRADIGLTRLKQSLEHARNSVRSEVRDALSVCIAGYEAGGQPDVALVYLHELLAHNREVRAAQWPTALSEVAGELSLHHGDATEQLNTAKALELQCTVDRCVADLVNSAITSAEQAGHDRLRIFRVSRLTETLVTSMGWDSARARSLGFAARLADIGMLVIPTEILNKTRALSEAERKIVAEHTLFGAEVLAKAGLGILKPCVPLARFHHERWDGAGPWGLKGDAVPIEARIYALCDNFDAMTHDRPWRKAMSLPESLMVIRDAAGKRFDPDLAAAFISMVKTIYWEHKDFEGFLAQDAFENSYVLAREELDRLIRGEGQRGGFPPSASATDG